MPPRSSQELQTLFSRSPFSLRQEIRLLRARGGRCAMALDVATGHTQGLGRVHGGIVTALADTAATFAAYSVIGSEEQLLTTNLSLAFTAGARAGDEMTAEAEVIHAGRTTVVAETRVLRGDGATMASGHFTMIRMAGRDGLSPSGG